MMKDDFDLDMRTFCILYENPGMSFNDAQRCAIQEEREEYLYQEDGLPLMKLGTEVD